MKIEKYPECSAPTFLLAGAIAASQEDRVMSVTTKKIVGSLRQPDSDEWTLIGQNFSVSGDPVAQGMSQHYEVIITPKSDSEQQVTVARLTVSLMECKRQH